MGKNVYQAFTSRSLYSVALEIKQKSQLLKLPKQKNELCDPLKNVNIVTLFALIDDRYRKVDTSLKISYLYHGSSSDSLIRLCRLIKWLFGLFVSLFFLFFTLLQRVYSNPLELWTCLHFGVHMIDIIKLKRVEKKRQTNNNKKKETMSVCTNDPTTHTD